MKQKFSLAVCAFVFAGTAFSQQESGEQCKNNVEVFVSGIEFAAQQKGIEPKLKDLTVNEIREIQKAQGNCVAEQEIRKRVSN